jgi:hypothetical protein
MTPDGWMFEHHKDPNCHVHNHAPSLDPSAHTSRRKVTTPVKGMVQRLSAFTAIKAWEINAMVREDYPGSYFKDKDINKARQRARLAERDGCMASGAMIEAFDDLSVAYVPNIYLLLLLRYTLELAGPSI